MIELVVAVRSQSSQSVKSNRSGQSGPKAVAKWTLACHNMTSGLGVGHFRKRALCARSIGLLETQLWRKRVLLCT